MAMELEDFEVLRLAESLADEIWPHVIGWDVFARDSVGSQLTRVVDSIGANIAESHGRFHSGEKINPLCYARGSLFETKYWLNRCRARRLLKPELVSGYAERLTEIARQINRFTKHLKGHRSDSTKPTRAVREPAIEYIVRDDDDELIFTDADFQWLNA